MRLLAILVITYSLGHAQSPTDEAYPALERFVEVLESVRKRHPDLEKVSYERLVNHALEGMLASLDSHSSFIHPEMSLPQKDDQAINTFISSLGLTLSKNSDGIFISHIEKIGPAAKAQLLPKTRIKKVNDSYLTERSLPECLTLFQGSPGDKIEILIHDPERPGEKTVTLYHRYVEERSLVASLLLKDNPEIGYLRLGTFGADCAREVELALDDLEDKGMKTLIFDLRENGGGDLHETVKILGLFVPPNTTVVSVRERGKKEEFLKTTSRQRRVRAYPIYVVIDKNSASASELTAGALQDLKRASILGELSYGKGSVQNIIPMSSNTALRLTIATYHTPSGRTPHLQGIKPDLAVDFSNSDRQFFIQKYSPAALPTTEQEIIDSWIDPAIQVIIKDLAK